jgi:hypothetical protein
MPAMFSSECFAFPSPVFDTYQGWRKLYNEELHKLYICQILLLRSNQEDEVGRACIMH